MKNSTHNYIWISVFILLFAIYSKNNYVNVQIYKFKEDKSKKDKDKLEDKNNILHN